MKSKSKRGKAIIGIAMAAIMLAALMAIVPAVSATDSGFSPYNGTAVANYTAINSITIVSGTKDVNISAWALGKSLVTTLTGSITLVGAKDTAIKGETIDVGDVSKFDVLTSWKEGLYGVGAADASETIYIKKPTITTAIKLMDDTDVTGKSVVAETQVKIVVTTNFGATLGKDENATTIKLKVIDPDGTEITKDDIGNSLTKEGATGVRTDKITFSPIQFNETGVYKITAMTPDPGVVNNSKLVAKAGVVTLTLITEVISIDVEKPTVTEGKDVIVTGSGSVKTTYRLETDGGMFKSDVKNVAIITNTTANVTTDASGIYRAVIDTTGEETGSYTVYIEKGTADEDKVEFEIVEAAATVETDKTTYILGEDVTISGTTTTGDNVIIAIADKFERTETIKADDTYEYRWTDTEGETIGSYKIEVWIDTILEKDGYTIPTSAGESTKSLPASDATTVVYLSAAELTAELSTNLVAIGDDFKVTGTAKGADNVNVVVVAPKGTGGTTINTGVKEDMPSIYKEKVSVSAIDYKFERKIDIKDGADTGKYLVMVLCPGNNRYYDKYGTTTGEIFDAANPKSATTVYRLDAAAKTQENFLSVIRDYTVDAAGSDDLIWLGYINVKTGEVTLNPIASVGVGEPLNITGTTNRKEGYPIMVEVKKTALAKSVLVENGTFSVTFDTTGVPVDTYTVEADDGDGHTDTVTVEIVTAVPVATPTATPTAEPTVKPTEPPVPTVEPTVEPTEEPTPEPPGFEAVFAIAGMLAIAYLVLRKRK